MCQRWGDPPRSLHVAHRGAGEQGGGEGGGGGGEGEGEGEGGEKTHTSQSPRDGTRNANEVTCPNNCENSDVIYPRTSPFTVSLCHLL